jgi:quercetin dioxygenase-like cupin family protein
MRKYTVLAFTCILLIGGCNKEKKPKTTDLTQPTDTIFSKGSRITNNNFKGNAWLQPLVENDSVYYTPVGNVTFEPGARTNWHFHPGGQILLATGGTGYYQEKGGPKKILRKGDVVKCPPDTPHWHGASHDDQFIQIAITPARNGPTQWLEPVKEEEYNAALND